MHGRSVISDVVVLVHFLGSAHQHDYRRSAVHTRILQSNSKSKEVDLVMARWGVGVSVGPIWASRSMGATRRRRRLGNLVWVLCALAVAAAMFPKLAVVIVLVDMLLLVYVITEPGRRIKRWLRP